MTSAAATQPDELPVPTPSPPAPVLSRLLRGTFWLALKTPAQMVIGLWSIPLTIHYIGKTAKGAYDFAWSFGFLQFVLEFGMSSALQKQVVDAYARGDRDGVNRLIGAGMNFYAVVALVQMTTLIVIAQAELLGEFRGNALVVQLLWVQVLTAPFFGMSAVVGAVLQAAGRYEFIPRLELLIILLRFGLLWVGYGFGLPFVLVVVSQIAVQVGLSLGPGLWVMVRDLGFVPHFGGATRADYASMLHVSLYLALLQWSVALADKVDALVLGYALRPDLDGLIDGQTAGYWVTVYGNVSKPFFQIRQAGWTLAYLVMPAVVSLAAGGDRLGLERIKYDGSRYIVGLLVPPTLLAAIYAAPFLDLWVGPEFVPHAWMLRLFLVATLPLMLSTVTQMAIGMGHIRPIAVSAFVGSLVNLPVSYFWTYHYGMAGVIWGTVLTTLLSNFLVPMLVTFPVLGISYREFWSRTLSPPAAGALALLLACGALNFAFPADPPGAPLAVRVACFVAHLALGCLAYAAGYASRGAGLDDLRALRSKALGRLGIGRGVDPSGR